MKNKHLSDEELKILYEAAEKVVCKNGLPSFKEVQSMLVKALQDSCKPGITKDELYRVKTVAYGCKVYLDIMKKQINYLLNCYLISRSFEEETPGS